MHRLLCYIIIFAGPIIFCIDSTNKPLYAQTQFEMSKKFNKEFAAADAELTRIYNRILKTYKDDKEFIEKLKVAQRLWIQFRDAHMDSLFPAEDKRLEYGSSFEMCFSAFLTKLTRERTEQLKQWIIGVEEGEVCSGSIKAKDTLLKK